MTRGRCGSLALHRTTLSFATPRRFNPAHRSHAMKEPIIVRLEDTEPVSFGPLSQYQLIIGDDEGTTPVRTGIQTVPPGYVAADDELVLRERTDRKSTRLNSSHAHNSYVDLGSKNKTRT